MDLMGAESPEMKIPARISPLDLEKERWNVINTLQLDPNQEIGRHWLVRNHEESPMNEKNKGDRINDIKVPGRNQAVEQEVNDPVHNNMR